VTAEELLTALRTATAHLPSGTIGGDLHKLLEGGLNPAAAAIKIGAKVLETPTRAVIRGEPTRCPVCGVELRLT